MIVQCGLIRQCPKPRHQRIQHREPPDAREDFIQGDGVISDLRRERAVDVDPDAHGDPRPLLPPPPGLAQDAGQLAVVHHDVVGPLELGRNV